MIVNKDFEILENNILKNREYFENLLSKIQNENDLKNKEKLAKKAINFALHSSTGYYSSDIIENVFLDISKNNSLNNLDENFEKIVFYM